jgi:hypothetical protein
MCIQTSKWILLLPGFVLLLLADGPALAETVSLTISSADAAPDTKAAVPLRIENPQGLGALQFVAVYDPSALEAMGAEAGEVFAGLVDSNVVAPGRLRVALVTNEGVSADGELVRLLFEVRGTEASRVTIEDARAWEQASGLEMAVSAEGGTLTIGAAPPGGLPAPLLLAGGLLVLVVLGLALRRK